MQMPLRLDFATASNGCVEPRCGGSPPQVQRDMVRSGPGHTGAAAARRHHGVYVYRAHAH